MTTVDLACPQCGSTELATREDLSGSAYGKAETDPVTGERIFAHEGTTEVHWDSSETIGYECQGCDWQGHSLDELAVAS